MEEKKQVKISLGTAICIFIIILLVIALIGTIIYYNTNNKKENIIQENEINDTENNIIETGEYIFNVPQALKEEMGHYYDDISIQIIDSKNYEFYLEEGFYIKGKYAIENGNLICKADVRGGEYLKEEKVEFECYFKINDNKNIELTKVSGELSDSEILKIGNTFTLREENTEIIEVEEDYINVEEMYVYSTYNEFEQNNYPETFQKIGFSSEGNFLIETGDFSVTGQYESTDKNIKKCKIEKYSFDQPDGRKTVSLKDAGWFIEFKNLHNEKLKVISNNIDGESEIAISLSGEFALENEFVKYNIKDFVGTWTSGYAYKLEEDQFGGSYFYKVESLTEIFGTSYINTGSKFTFNEDGSFEDYVEPVTESNMYRKGTYTLDNENEISLKYEDGNKEIKMYIIGENTIVYDTGYDRIFLVK